MCVVSRQSVSWKKNSLPQAAQSDTCTKLCYGKQPSPKQNKTNRPTVTYCKVKNWKEKLFFPERCMCCCRLWTTRRNSEMSDKRLEIIYPTRDLPITTPYFLSILCAIAWALLMLRVNWSVKRYFHLEKLNALYVTTKRKNQPCVA